jgi:hypothetical protein
MFFFLSEKQLHCRAIKNNGNDKTAEALKWGRESL